MRGRVAILVLLLATAAACRDGGEVSDRLDRLEQRLERLEASTMESDDVAEVLRGIVTDVDDLERRFEALEVRRQRGPVRRVEPGNRDRAAELRAFRKEFEERKARLHEQYGADPDSPEYQAALHALRVEREQRLRELSGPGRASADPGGS